MINAFQNHKKNERVRIPSIRLFFFFTLLFFIFFSLNSKKLALCEEADAILSIEEAEKEIVSAYLNLLEAETAGANITSLAIQINDAYIFLVQAKLFIDDKQFNKSLQKANLCIISCNSVSEKALILQDLAIRQSEQKFRNTFILTNILIAITAISSLICWQLFKSRYNREILEKKPQVISPES